MNSVKHVDYVVIGAGFAGLATAYFLAAQGKSGIILERADHIGAHASGRNAGMFRQLHDDRLLMELAIRSQHFFQQAAWKNLLQSCGSILLTHEATTTLLPTPALDTTTWTRQQALQTHPELAAFNFSTALSTASDGVIDIQGLLAMLLQGALSGFMLRTQSTVTRATLQADAMRLETTHGEITAKVVINATGAWAADVATKLGGAVMPLQSYKRHLLQFKSPPFQNLQTILWHLDDAYYFRPAAAGWLSSIADTTAVAAGDETCEPNFADHYRAQMQRLAPQSKIPTIDKIWACQRTFATDQRPLVGWDPINPQLFWMAGLGGSGATTCLALGEYAATLLTTSSPQALQRNSGMSPDRF